MAFLQCVQVLVNFSLNFDQPVNFYYSQHYYTVSALMLGLNPEADFQSFCVRVLT